MRTLEHFRLKIPSKCGNHEIALISPSDNFLVSSNTPDLNGATKQLSDLFMGNKKCLCT